LNILALRNGHYHGRTSFSKDGLGASRAPKVSLASVEETFPRCIQSRGVNGVLRQREHQTQPWIIEAQIE